MAQVKDFTPAELDEIRTSYRQAKSPRTQVDVLARAAEIAHALRVLSERGGGA